MKTEKCKGCKGPMRKEKVHNALSRYGHGYICSNCGTMEAMVGNFIKDKKNTP